MTPDLKILADNKKDLLLAEIAAWLHDMGKCSDEMIEKQASDCPSSPSFQSNTAYKTAFSNLLNGNNHTLSLLNETVTLKELIEKGIPSAIKNNTIQSLLIKYLGRCHAAAHIEKEGQADKKQTIKDTRLSSPFGDETEPLADLTKRLQALPFNEISNREKFLPALKKAFKKAPGDTERPINEVDLWDWSSIVAALYKSALAGALLGNKPEPNDLKWRLLAIRFNSEQILGNASKIPVLLARKKWLTDGLDNVKKMLEETYPLGNEVYRDESGSIFVVPDVQNLLGLKENANSSEKSLKDLISERLGFEGEIVVTPSLSVPWWGQNPSGRPDPSKDKIPPIGKILQEKPYSPPDPEKIKEWWEEATSRAQKEGHNNPEICTISWTRPQGPTERGFQRKASDFWAEKVTGRAKEWNNKDKSKTIWIDEVADNNGRICLITGKLDISEWLTPEGHVRTLFVKPPNGKSSQDVQKKPSFARLRRIWETTKKFWEEVEHGFDSTIGRVENRLVITGNGNKINELITNNVYEMEIDRTRASVFYSENGHFIIIENLKRLARKMGCKAEQNPLEFIQNCLKDKDVKIYNTESKNRDNSICDLKISSVEPIVDNYIPAISILSEPSIFMTIVPAGRSLEIAKNIKEKYEKEMGKVRNRLPLILGMVFARSHTPLAALMDAGRRILKISTGEEDWVLNGDAGDCGTDCILNFDNGITWQIPVKMGDGVTDDIWYPYFYVNGVPANCSRAFKGPKGWLVHVKELKKGYKVKIASSRFDFEFLDTSSRRFEVSYENGKRRDTTKSERPYLLEEIDDFIRLWDTLSGGLVRSQIKNVISLIETKREEWLPEEGNNVFEKFVHDILHNANWKDGIPANIEELEKAAISGKLKDIVELNMDILKVRNMDKKEQEVSE